MEVADPDEPFVIVQVPEAADTRYTLVWVGGAGEMVPETVGVTV